MAERVETFVATITAGTAASSPLTTSLPFALGVVTRIELRIPPGPSGLMGFRVGHSAQIVIPNDGTSWLITDDEVIVWDLTGYPTGSAWYIEGYNTGDYDHSIYIRVLIDEIADNAPTFPQLLTIE